MNNSHLDLSLAHNIARGLFDLAQCALESRNLPAAAQTLHTTAWEINDTRLVAWDAPKASLQRVAMVLTIDAMLAAPEVTMEAIKRLRDDLVELDPALALIR